MTSDVSAKEILMKLRAEVCTTAKQREIFDWAADPAEDFAESEDAIDERAASGESLEAYIRDDMAYRLGEQLQDMAEDQRGQDQGPQALATARVAAVLAEKLERGEL
jgi:hypothetical protein